MLAWSQKDSSKRVYITDTHGNVRVDESVKTIYEKKETKIYKITSENVAKVLMLSKYLDSTKPIRVCIGSNTSILDYSQLKAGHRLSEIQTKNVFSCKVVNGNLLLSGTAFWLDGKYSAKIEKNVLVNSPLFEQYGSNNWLEVINEYDIPILQVVLKKSDNSIVINGVFFSDDGCEIDTSGTAWQNSYDTPFLYMSQSSRDSVLHEIIERTRGRFTLLHNQ